MNKNFVHNCIHIYLDDDDDDVNDDDGNNNDDDDNNINCCHQVQLNVITGYGRYELFKCYKAMNSKKKHE